MRIFLGAALLLPMLWVSLSGQTPLYNGITLPFPWPPQQNPTQEYQLPSYLTSPPTVIPIDVGRQLFVDDFLIEQSSLIRNAHRPTMYASNPILTPSAAAKDSAGLTMPYSDGVWYDPADKLFKMWYYGGYGNMICYIYSTDGKTWVRPSIPDAVVPNSNMVLQIGTQRDSATVWMDLADIPSRKFKAFAVYPYSNPSGWFYQVFFSADGIHWTQQTQYTPPSVYRIPSVSDRSTVFYNPFRGVWVNSARSSTTLPATSSAPSHYTRVRYYAESPDLLNWTPADPLDAFWAGPDVNDPPYAGPGGALPELYNLDAVAYESLMVGMFSWFNPGPSYDPSYADGPDLVELGVGFSRDGFNWLRPTRGGAADAFIPATNAAGTWNAYNTQSAGGGFLVVGDELWFYFSGRSVKKPDSGGGSTGLAILRRDGFYSMDAGASQGVLTTRPVQFSGNHFFVNVNDPQGALRVEALDSTGNVIQPFSAANSSVISTNKTLQEVTWNGAADLSSLAGSPVKFRFYLTSGELYSFWVGDANGASHGYVAAGGPGFTGSTDTVGLSGYADVPPPPPPDETVPVASITAPWAGQSVFGVVTVTATATDNVGVAGIQLKLDGGNLGPPCTGSPCSYNWDTGSASGGNHTLSAVAFDGDGNQGLAPDVTVNVSAGSGPVGYWTFDSGQIASGKVLDSSGNNLIGTLSGGVTPAAGQMAQALSFNGANGSVPFGPDTLTDLTGNVTLAAWVKTTNHSRTEALISRYSASGSETGYLLRTAPSGHPEVRIGGYNLSGSGARNFTDNGKLINDGQWHHVAAVILIGQGVSFYIDGAPSSTQSATVVARAGGANLTLGLNGWTPFGTYFTGSLDDVRIYNWAMGPTSVAVLASITPTAGTPVITPPGGTYSGSVSVTMSSSTPTATIYYTTDGSSPGTGSNQYGGALNLTSNTTLKAIAVASGMNDSAIASAAFTITAAPPPSDTVAPMVTVTSPAGTVSGTVTVTATATDNVGVSSVQLKLDGNNLGNACAGSPCSYSWDTTTATNASHTLSAVALDAANNAGVAPDVTVTVANVVTPPPGGGSGPVGYWTFDSGQIASGKVLDSSGNNLAGTLSGGVTPAAGQMAQALAFNGANGSVQFGPDALTDLTGDVTLAAWVKTTNSSRTEALISRYSAGGSETGYLLRTAPSGHPELRIGGYNLSGSGAKVFTDTGKLINDGQWHHVAAVILIGQGVSFYIDGAPTSTQSATVAARAGGANLTLGLNGWTPFGTYFTGSLDDVRIYNRALAAAEVASLAAGGGTPTAGKPVITPPGGTYSGSVSVTMSSSTPTATIYYTTDGSSPGTGSNQYGGALNLTSNTTLKAIAVASGMNDSAIASAAFTITAAPPPSDTVAPMVTVTSPAGTVSGTVTVTATATDNVGVSSVQLKLDGNNLGNACAGSPCSYSWDTTTATNASHTLSAVALDAANNAGVAPDVTVTVANVVTPPPGGGSGPVGYWTFDSGQIASGKVLDSSGNNLAGTLSGGVTPAAGQMAQALAFNGANGSVQFGPDALTDLTGDVTLAAWVKTTNSSRTEALISRYSAGGSETGYLLRTAPSGHPELRIGGYNLSGSGAKVFTDTGKLINDGQWHHVAAVILIGQGVSFYIDGAPTSTQSATVAARAGGANLTLGLNGWTPFGTYFTGSLDDVRIYNRALAAAEVATLASGAASGGADTEPPSIASGTPVGLFPAGTAQLVLGVTTNELATCRYSTTPGVAYAAMTNLFATTGSSSHSTPLPTLQNGLSYNYYVRCQDVAGNANLADYPVSFSVASTNNVNSLATTPPLGWNSWNHFGSHITDAIVRQIADAMVSTGMQAAGYTYVNIDAYWGSTQRDSNGALLPNANFPDMKALADYVHSKGLKIGIYSSPGPTGCDNRMGSLGHEQQDANTFAQWGIDYLKYDWCSASGVYQLQDQPAVFKKMGDALIATGRPIVYSLSQYGQDNVWTWGASAGANLWRVSGDIQNDWSTMSGIGFSQYSRYAYAGPGHWNDPDMLEIGNGGLTDDESRTHMSLWAILAAPLLAGNDLRSMTQSTLDILLNTEVIAVDQDPAGVQGHRLSVSGTQEIWVKPLSNGAVAVGLFNRDSQAASMSVSLTDLGLPGTVSSARDLWAHQAVTLQDGAFQAVVASHGVVMLLIQP